MEALVSSAGRLELESLIMSNLSEEVVAAHLRAKKVGESRVVGFRKALADRAGWLCVLSILQSFSSFILAGNEGLIRRHPAIVFFLTMLVGAGGNAGNQSAVLIIRELATGGITGREFMPVLRRQCGMACLIAATVTTVGFVRVLLFGTDLGECIAIAVSLYVVVLTSILIGAALPLMLNAVSIDPAHASTTIQVIMDIMGVLIVCVVSAVVLEGGWLPQWLLEADLDWRSDPEFLDEHVTDRYADKKPLIDKMRSFFAHYDSDHSGGLEKQEFTRLIRGFGVTMTASESESLIAELSNDADEADAATYYND